MTDEPEEHAREAGCEAGFTLVELLVALALFSLLVTLLFGNVRFGLLAWQQGSTHADNFEHNLASQDLLRRMIGNIYPMLITDGGTKSRIDFDGTKEAISFLGNAPIVASGGRFRFRFMVERRPNRTDLVMSSAPELANPQDSSMSTKRLLIADIDRAEFSYFGGAEVERRIQWRDDWSKRSELPGLVRVRVAFRPGDTRQWPELLIAPRITADVSCVYDPTTMRCRGR